MSCLIEMSGDVVIKSAYVGRFAPSPTGLLHMGSLMAAVASYLDARSAGGRWLLRIEDLDPPRELLGASNLFIETLLRFGFEWDGEIVWQGQRGARYQQVLDSLLECGLAYPCSCTRKMLQAAGRRGVDGLVYSGLCRSGASPCADQLAYRLKVPDEVISVADRIQQVTVHNLFCDVGDFILRRADQLWAYQLAVVVDDADTGVTDVVRGADLLDSTPRQVYLQRVLGFPVVRYLHIPVITNMQGEKLSKQTCAPALRDGREVEQLWLALSLLYQNPPLSLRRASLAELWCWAVEAWDVAKFPQKRSVAVTIDDNYEFKFQL